MKNSTREELRELVDQLPDECLEEARDYVQWLLQGDDTVTPEDLEDARLGAEEIARGDYITLDEHRRASLE
jgi:hypothetical protein